MQEHGLSNHVTVMRFRILEALIEEYGKKMPRDAARQRLALLDASQDIRLAALIWFDLRWPEASK